MSRYLQINDQEDAAELSSNSGWTQFHEWVATLDAEEFPALVEFTTNGTTDTPQLVCDQVESAMEDSPPIPDVQSIADNLMEYLDGESGSASVV